MHKFSTYKVPICLHTVEILSLLMLSHADCHNHGLVNASIILYYVILIHRTSKVHYQLNLYIVAILTSHRQIKLCSLYFN